MSFKIVTYSKLRLITLAVIAILLVLWYLNKLPLIIVFIPLVLQVIIQLYSSFSINSQFYINAICKFSDNNIYITFDDGPHPNTPQILDLLKENNAKASFFLIGKNVQKYPEIAKRIANEGHAIGLHTYNHSKLFPLLRVKQIEKELEDNNNAIFNITGVRTNIFRPPFGITNPLIAKAIKNLNLSVIGWNIRSLDTVNESSEKVTKKIIKKLKPGSIILLHDYTEISINVLKNILLFAKEKDLKTSIIK